MLRGLRDSRDADGGVLQVVAQSNFRAREMVSFWSNTL
jgi:hypothetical protein